MDTKQPCPICRAVPAPAPGVVPPKPAWQSTTLRVNAGAGLLALLGAIAYWRADRKHAAGALLLGLALAAWNFNNRFQTSQPITITGPVTMASVTTGPINAGRDALLGSTETNT